jgi:hypothetical protein
MDDMILGEEDMAILGLDEGDYDEEDLEGLYELGFRLPFRLPFGRGRGRRLPVRRSPAVRAGVRQLTARIPTRASVLTKPPLINPIPGVPGRAGAYLPLGLGRFNFTSATATSNTFTTNPQKPVRPRRLWITIARSAGASGIAVDVTDIKVGTASMLAGVESIPAEQFAPDAFAKEYNLFESATPGVEISVIVSLSAAPDAGENVNVSVSMDCESLV